MLYCWIADRHGIPLDCRWTYNKLAIASSDFKTHWVSINRVQPIGMIEPHSDLSGSRYHVAVRRSAELGRFAVRHSSRGECKAGSNGLFIWRMDIIRISQISGDCHSRVRQIKRTSLCLAND